MAGSILRRRSSVAHSMTEKGQGSSLHTSTFEAVWQAAEQDSSKTITEGATTTSSSNWKTVVTFTLLVAAPVVVVSAFLVGVVRTRHTVVQVPFAKNDTAASIQASILPGNEGMDATLSEYDTTTTSSTVDNTSNGNDHPVRSSGEVLDVSMDSSRIAAGNSLSGSIYSANGSFYLSLSDSDGNLCIYNAADDDKVQWCTGVTGQNNAAMLQDDCNFVVQQEGQVTWSTDTAGHHDQGCYLEVENSGSIAIYDTTDGTKMWRSARSQLAAGETLVAGSYNSSLVSEKGLYSVNVQDDGNVCVMQNELRTNEWCTKTAGAPGGAGAVLQMQDDGNLVVYHGGTGNNAKWNAGTHSSGSYALIQDDGNFIVYDTDNRAVWDRIRGDV